MKKFEVIVEKAVYYTHVFEVEAVDEHVAGDIARTMATRHGYEESEVTNIDYQEVEVTEAKAAAKVCPSYEDFVEKYQPIKNTITPNEVMNGVLFETFGADLDFVARQDVDRVWTLIHDEDGQRVVQGCKKMNRLGYFVTTKAYDGGEDSFVILETFGVIHDQEGIPEVFVCLAEDTKHAIEQALNSNPETNIVGFMDLYAMSGEERTVTAFFDVDSDDPEALKPAIAKIVFTREVIDEIARLSAESAGVRALLDATVSQTAPYNMVQAIQWESQDNVRPEECNLVFWRNQFWFSAKPDNGGARFDTFPVSIEKIQKLFEFGYNSTVFITGSDNIEQLMDGVEESELQ